MKAETKIVGSSEMAKRMRAYDWSATSLGPVSDWPQSLLTTTNFLLQSPVPIVLLWGSEGVMLYNDAYSEFAGKRHPKLLGSKVVDGWPEVADFNRNVMAMGLRGETLIYEDQKLVLYRNNEPEDVWMDLTYSPIIDESGKPGGVIAVVIETTDRILAEQRQTQAENSLKKERQRLESIFMQAPAMIAILRGPDHVFELANPEYLKLVGNRDIIGKSVREAIPEAASQGFVKILDTVYKTGKPYRGNEIPFDLDDGKGDVHHTYLNFVFQPSFDGAGNVDGVLVHAVEVTDMVSTRQRIEEIANVSQTITDNATTGLMIMDSEHFCRYMNPAAEKITGFTLKDIQASGKTLHDVVHYKKANGSPYPIDDCPTSKAVLKKKRVISDDHFVRPDGSVYPIALMSSPIIQDGKAIGIVEEIRDTTREKEADREIRQLNKELEQRVEERTTELTAANKELNRSNEELQDFAYVASHDLQEPLRKIAAFSNLLEEDYGELLPEEAQQYLAGLMRSSLRMRTLIDDLLTYSRVATRALPFKKVDIGKLARESLEDLQTRIDETHAKITIDSTCKVEADPLQIRLLFQNLISNALKYAKPDVTPEIHVSSKVAGDQCEIHVADNGIGFEEHYVDRIFTIFQRLHGKNEYEGTGVGLAICKKIVDRHGGTITARSTPGKGATFIVRLPVK